MGYGLEQVICSFIASCSFGIILNVPKRTIPYCGLGGVIGWCLYKFSYWILTDQLLSNFIASLGIGLICIFLAKKLRTPVIVLKTPSIVPLVPGGAGYMAVRAFVEQNYHQGVDYMIDTLAIAAGIIFGFLVVNLIEKQWLHSRYRRL